MSNVHDELFNMQDDDEFDPSSSSDEDTNEDGEDNGYEDDDTFVSGHDGAMAEMEIEGDFDRLLHSIRGTDGTSAAGLLSKEWDFNIQDKDAEFRQDLRIASGIGRQHRRKHGRAPGPILSQQVRALIGEGNQAYVDWNLPEAIRIMQEVIRIEPRAHSAWSVLAQCYEDQDEPQKALQLRIMAAHLRHDAEEWEHLAKQSKYLGYIQQALYCFRKLCSLDPTNVDAQWDRASLAKKSGDLRTAQNAFLAILKQYPHDLTVMAELRPILIDLSEFSLCAALFQAAFDHYQAVYPLGPPSADSPPATTSAAPSWQSQCFTLLEILVLADLYNTPALSAHDRAITTIRKGSRWLQGRGAQKMWDALEDDREYDLPGSSTRTGTVQPGCYALDVNARQRLAVARIKLGDIEEGTMHASIVLSHDVADYAPLFAEIADAYFEQGLYGEAKGIYELLGADAGTSSLYILMQTASCYRMLGELREAADVYEHVKSADPRNNDAKMKLAEIYEILNEPRKALELVYEVIGSRKQRPANSIDPDTTQSGSLFEEKTRPSGKSGKASRVRNRLSMNQLKEMEEGKEKEVVKGFKRYQELWSQLGTLNDEKAQRPDRTEVLERELLVETEKLVEAFRETRNLFLTARSNPFRGMFPRQRRRMSMHSEADENRMASRLHLDLEHDGLTKKLKGTHSKAPAVDIFRGVSFNDWLEMFMRYSFLLTRHDQYESADEVLRHILLSNAYQTRESQDLIRLTLIACAIAINRYSVVVEQARKLISLHQFNNEPMRILLASLTSGLSATDAFITSTLQKHILREMRLWNSAVKNPESLKWHQLNNRWVFNQTAASGKDLEDALDDIDDDAPGEQPAGLTRGKDEQLVLRLPTKDNPVVLAIYGQLCSAAKSYQSAIFYLLYAYESCPNDPMVCLSLAIASIGRAMQRQADNRHHLIAQAMAFLSRYRAIRSLDAETAEEIEFNFGRAFQQLGLHSLAVRHYERVLELAESKPSNPASVAREAAYNLSLIFVTTGATSLAESLYQRWLSI